MNPADIRLHVSATNGKPQRIVIASTRDGHQLHRDNLDTNSQVARERFFRRLAQKTSIPADKLVRMLDDLLVTAADEADAKADAEASQRVGRDNERRPSQATMLVELADDVDLWHTPDGDAYATITSDEHRETWPVRSKGFKRWLNRLFFLMTGGAANSQAMQDALGVIEGKAIYEGVERMIHTRLAEYGGNTYLDLGDPEWRVAEISTVGWNVIDNPPVRFRRAKAMMQLPTPIGGGSMDQLRALVNVTDEDWPLVVAWLLAALRASGPYPVLCLHGEQGSAKSTTARMLRSLVDPNMAPLRSEPREPRDLMIAANNGWVLALDNLSRVQPWLSDALCRLSTGGGYSTRTLYENDEETIFYVQRPIILTGIEELATRGDLLDRSLLVNLTQIPEHRRRPEREFWADFEQLRPSIFGALLTAVSVALARLPGTRLDQLPRMADFALWVTAGESALGLNLGQFLEAYKGNCDAGNELALEASPVTTVLMEFVATTLYWEGSASDLLCELEAVAGEKTRQLKSWPKAAKSLSGTLKRLAPNLRASGVDVEIGRTKKGRFIVVRRIGREFCVANVTSVTDPAKPAVSLGRGDAKTTQDYAAVTQENPAGDAGDADDARIPAQSEVGNESEMTPEDAEAYLDFMGS